MRCDLMTCRVHLEQGLIMRRGKLSEFDDVAFAGGADAGVVGGG